MLDEANFGEAFRFVAVHGNETPESLADFRETHDLQVVFTEDVESSKPRLKWPAGSESPYPRPALIGPDGTIVLLQTTHDVGELLAAIEDALP